MERSLIKRALPYVEALCFAAAWVVGISVAVQQPAKPPAVPRERDLVVSDRLPPAADISGPHHRFRPIPRQELQEGG